MPPRPARLQAGWSQELEPGTYLARVTFPSGEHIAKTCTLAEGETTTVPIDVHGLSGHESLERSAVLRLLPPKRGSAGSRGAEVRICVAEALGTRSGIWLEPDPIRRSGRLLATTTRSATSSAPRAALGADPVTW